MLYVYHVILFRYGMEIWNEVGTHSAAVSNELLEPKALKS